MSLKPSLSSLTEDLFHNKVFIFEISMQYYLKVPPTAFADLIENIARRL